MHAPFHFTQHTGVVAQPGTESESPHDNAQPEKYWYTCMDFLQARSPLSGTSM
jgi:hypothetical protein